MPIKTNLLTDDLFHSTMAEPMRAPPEDADAPCDIWAYVNAIPELDFAGFNIANTDIEMVRRTGDQKYDHVLIPTETRNVYMVIVVDVFNNLVFGHHVLNLNEKYGLETPDCR